MNEGWVIKYITDTFRGVHTVANGDATFFFYDPDHESPADDRFPFITIVSSDAYDQFSNLSRPSVFRLNIGVSKATFRALFAEQTNQENDESEDVGTGYDFTLLDQMLPHPVYGRMYWVCILNPSEATFAALVKPLLDEAYNMAAAKYSKQAARLKGKENGSED